MKAALLGIRHCRGHPEATQRFFSSCRLRLRHLRLGFTCGPVNAAFTSVCGAQRSKNEMPSQLFFIEKVVTVVAIALDVVIHVSVGILIGGSASSFAIRTAATQLHQ